MAHATRRGVARYKASLLPPDQHVDPWAKLGQPIRGTYRGRLNGTKVPDFENLFRRVDGNLALLTGGAGAIYVVHFRHPTKRRTPGRVSNIRFFRKDK